ncbi:hypothetical protein [Metallosphaera sp.]|uniref:hypothetical protein n=1 Tax=Metallosphaera sp. TaxID=2020860 RepID=UPI00317424B8
MVYVVEYDRRESLMREYIEKKEKLEALLDYREKLIRKTEEMTKRREDLWSEIEEIHKEIKHMSDEKKRLIYKKEALLILYGRPKQLNGNEVEDEKNKWLRNTLLDIDKKTYLLTDAISESKEELNNMMTEMKNLNKEINSLLEETDNVERTRISLALEVQSLEREIKSMSKKKTRS